MCHVMHVLTAYLNIVRITQKGGRVGTLPIAGTV